MSVNSIIFQYIGAENECKSKHLSLGSLAQLIASKKYAKRVEMLRRSIDHLNYNKVYADRVPCIFPAWGKDGYTGLVLLTIKANNCDSETLRQRICAMAQTAMCFVSVSGKSFKVLVPFTLDDGTLPHEDEAIEHFHEHAYFRAVTYYEQMLGCEVDKKKTDIRTGCRFATDRGVYFNQEAVPMKMQQPTASLGEWLKNNPYSAPSSMAVVPSSVKLTDLEQEAVQFNFICRKLAFGTKMSSFSYINKVAEMCNDCGVSSEVGIQCLLSQKGMEGKELLIRTSFENAFDPERFGRKTAVPQRLVESIRIKDYLMNRYGFRRNELTGKAEFTDKDNFHFEWRNLDSHALSTAVLDAQSAGIVMGEKDIERITNSNHIAVYNPVDEYLNGLPEWDGHDYISDVAGMVHTNNPYFREYFGTWLRMMVRQWSQDNRAMYGATQVLLFIGAQGWHKSTFFRMLMPPELMAYYHDRIDFSTKRDAEQYLYSFCLVNIDEMDQTSPAQVAFLKHMLQEVNVKNRGVFEKDIQEHRRYAAFCATTNDHTPLRDPTGSRRYICVELTSDFDADMKTNPINHPQLFAQIKAEIKAGLPTYFDHEAETKIQLHNKQYTVINGYEDMFDSMFRPAKDDDENLLLLSSTDVLNELKMDYPDIKIDSSSITKMGTILTHKCGSPEREHKRKVYRVVKHEG